MKIQVQHPKNLKSEFFDEFKSSGLQLELIEDNRGIQANLDIVDYGLIAIGLLLKPMLTEAGKDIYKNLKTQIPNLYQKVKNHFKSNRETPLLTISIDLPLSNSSIKFLFEKNINQNEMYLRMLKLEEFTLGRMQSIDEELTDLNKEIGRKAYPKLYCQFDPISKTWNLKELNEIIQEKVKKSN